MRSVPQILSETGRATAGEAAGEGKARGGSAAGLPLRCRFVAPPPRVGEG